MPHLVFIVFLFVLGAVVGSFLNVLVYRMPRNISVVRPPSSCPQCNTRLAWYDNVPVLGWILLAGKCRYCRKPISPRYPIVEAVTGIIFAGYYCLYFVAHFAPCMGFISLELNWPIFFLDMVLLAGLLAASLIDAELFIIPAEIPWWIAGIAVVVHAAADRPGAGTSMMLSPPTFALATGAAIGLLLSILLLWRGILPMSFPQGDLLEVERAELNAQAEQAAQRGEAAPQIPDEMTPAQVRHEIRKEMLFLMPPMILGGLAMLLRDATPAVTHVWQTAAAVHWLSAAMGSLLGGMIGAFVVWLTRIAGSFGFGREAMGLGDVHLMLAVGAVLGGGAATVAFFIAPFFGIAVALYMLLTGTRRQLPYGPYLSLATAFTMLFYCPIADYFRPGLYDMIQLLRQAI